MDHINDMGHSFVNTGECPYTYMYNFVIPSHAPSTSPIVIHVCRFIDIIVYLEVHLTVQLVKQPVKLLQANLCKKQLKKLSRNKLCRLYK